MIDISFAELAELARQAELQKRVEADGVKAPEVKPVIMPEDLRGKLGEAEEAEGDRPSPRASKFRIGSGVPAETDRPYSADE